MAVGFTTFMVLSTRSQQPVGGGRPSGQPVAMPPNLVGLEIDLSEADDEGGPLQGEVRVSEGRVLTLQSLYSDEIQADGAQFRVAVKKQANTKKKKAAKKQALAGRTVLLATLEAPPSARVTIETGRGRIEIALADLTPGTPQGVSSTAGPRSSARRAAIRLTEAGTEGRPPEPGRRAEGHGLAGLCRLQGRSTPDGGPGRAEGLRHSRARGQWRSGPPDALRPAQAWRGPIDVTGGGLDVWRPAVAVDGHGVIVVAWSQHVDGNWDIYHRRFTPAEMRAARGRRSPA